MHDLHFSFTSKSRSQNMIFFQINYCPCPLFPPGTMDRKQFQCLNYLCYRYWSNSPNYSSTFHLMWRLEAWSSLCSRFQDFLSAAELPSVSILVFPILIHQSFEWCSMVAFPSFHCFHHPHSVGDRVPSFRSRRCLRTLLCPCFPTPPFSWFSHSPSPAWTVTASPTVLTLFLL